MKIKVDRTARRLGMDETDATAVLDHILSAPRRDVTVTNETWCVSATTSSREPGARLSAFRFANPKDLTTPIIYGDHHGRVFPSSDEAMKFALDHGYLRVYHRREWSGTARDDRMEVWPHVGQKQWDHEQARRARHNQRRNG